MRRRVLIVSDVSAEEVKGGAERMLARHVRALVGAGMEVVVLTRQPAPDAPLHLDLGPHAVEHRLRFSGERGPRGVRELVKGARAWLAIHHDAFDAVLAEQPFTLWALLQAGLEMPYLYCCYSFAHEEFLTRHGLDRSLRVRLAARAMRRMEARVYQTATRLLVLSSYTKQRLAEVFGIGAERVRIAPGGADPVPEGLLARRDEFRARFGWTGPVALTIRNLVPRTGVDLLIQAAAWLKPAHPELSWAIVGDGPFREALEALARGLGVDDRVRFYGHVPDAEAVRMRVAADLFVLPTRALEGFGLVIAEANLAGCPVVATPVGAIPEVAGNMPENRLARHADPEAIAEAVSEALAAPLQDEARQALAARAREVFAWRHHDAALTEELERLCASHI